MSKLTNRVIVQMVTALKSIPTLKRSPRGTYALAKNAAVLADALKPIQDASQALFKESFGEAKQVDANHGKFSDYQEAIRKLDEQETEVPIHMFKHEDLNLAENEINHADLAAIRHLISDW